MPAIEVPGIDGLREWIDREIGPTDWIEIDQQRIDAYADVSGDHQWIHVDRERAAKQSPYGATIAHGNLTLSLIDGFRRELVKVNGVGMVVNYGWDRVRFPAPVISGSRLRATMRLVKLEEVGDGWWHMVSRFTVEVEGGEKPCCVADSVSRLLAAPEGAAR
jgi:acyl dehydratase